MVQQHLIQVYQKVVHLYQVLLYHFSGGAVFSVAADHQDDHDGRTEDGGNIADRDLTGCEGCPGDKVTPQTEYTAEQKRTGNDNDGLGNTEQQLRDVRHSNPDK